MVNMIYGFEQYYLSLAVGLIIVLTVYALSHFGINFDPLGIAPYITVGGTP